MQRLVIDTNILVSALIQKSFPYFIINSLPANEKAVWCISDAVLEEYTDVLKRGKFAKYPGFTSNADSLLAELEEIAARYTPEIRLTIIKDHSDNKFLELALTCNAHFLITGNTKDFTMTTFGQTKIITPKEYWENHR